MSYDIPEETLNGELPDGVSEHNTTPLECFAMRLLFRDGWSSGVLKMTFHLSRNSAVKKHVTGRCGHSHGVPKVPVEQYESRDETR